MILWCLGNTVWLRWLNKRRRGKLLKIVMGYVLMINLKYLGVKHLMIVGLKMIAFLILWGIKISLPKLEGRSVKIVKFLIKKVSF